MALEIAGKVDVYEVLNLVKKRKGEKIATRSTINNERKQRATFCGESVKISSLRLNTFKQKGTICSHCGLKAGYFKVERKNSKDGFQLQLYGVKDGKEIIFTKDHIIPKSKGGKDCLNNMQTMCQNCNSKKGDKL